MKNQKKTIKKSYRSLSAQINHKYANAHPKLIVTSVTVHGIM